MDKLFYFFICIILAIAFESAMSDLINNAGITGITGAFFMALIPGAFILYVLLYVLGQFDSQ